jgi:hypothetical protein
VHGKGNGEVPQPRLGLNHLWNEHDARKD